jgi:UDP-N-acetylmuramoyl-tripeptide--D-alanyl-D-alanine ligase
MSFPGKKILIAGDIGEMGSESAESHIAVGAYAKSAGIDHLWAVGELSKLTIKAFGDAGIHCKDKNDLVKLCRDVANSKVVFLVKGSRSARMDSVVNEIRLDEDN